MTTPYPRTSWAFIQKVALIAAVFGASAGGIPTPAAAQAQPKTQTPAPAASVGVLDGRLVSIEKMVDEAHAQGLFRGNLLIAQNGKTILERSYGPAVIEWKLPLSSDVTFRLGSITKLFTSMTILKLAQDGKLQLNSTISDHLPYYRKDTGSKITIAELLDHSSGLPDFTTDPRFSNVISRLKIPTKEFIEKYGERDLLFPPGTSYYYSNTGYFILGSIIQAVTGKTYGENLESIVFKPLGMTRSGYDENSLVVPQSAEGYVMEGCQESVAPFAELSVPFSAGAAYSTAGDLEKFYAGLRTNTVLNKQYTELMLQPHIKEPSSFEGNPIYSTYGWDRFELQIPGNSPDNKVVVHSKSGEINGFVHLVLMTDKYFVATLSNSQDAYSANIGIGALSILYGVPPASVALQKSVLTLMREAICTSGAAGATAEYEQLRATLPAAAFSEAILSALGQNFLGIGLNNDVSLEDINRALVLFRLNAKYYPQVPGVYTDLASGDSKMANHLPAALQADGSN